MYVHLGNNYIISGEKIVAVLNYQSPVSSDLQEIVDIARLENKLIKISDKGKEKAVIVCDDKVYLSPISSITLYKRAFNYY
ncbi:orfx [hydrocarbon metagenome]|uniref:Orfx n=1 Tax=hydrocarbon metagenome TaxID=938273 RepID=A0A0W8E2E4_9ZZZZ